MHSYLIEIFWICQTHSVNNFTDYYRQQMDREKLAKRKALERRAARKRQLSNGSQTDSPFRHHHKSHQHSNSSTPRATTPSTHEAAAKPTAIHIGGPFFTIQRTGPDSAQSAREHQNDSQQRGIMNDVEHKAGLLEKRSVQCSKKFWFQNTVFLSIILFSSSNILVSNLDYL